MLKLRVLSALILAPAALACLLAGSVAFAVLVAVAVVIMAHEWNSLSTPTDQVALTALAGSILVVVVGATWLGRIDVAAGLGVCGIFALGAFARLRGRPVLWPALGLAYLAVPAVALVWLRGVPHGAWLVLWLLLVVWAVDIGAYAAGRGIGGPRLAPRISPGKTWSGLLGGVVAGASVAALAGNILDLGATLGIAGLGAGLAIAEQMGDLAESAFKRRFDAKDSGRLIPGHGGLLDRLDGLLAVAPIVALFVWWRLGQPGASPL